jgi:hypothetical protein
MFGTLRIGKMPVSGLQNVVIKRKSRGATSYSPMPLVFQFKMLPADVSAPDKGYTSRIFALYPLCRLLGVESIR